MADLAVGISKAAVEALVSKVQSAIKEEKEKWQTVQRDLVFITGEFEMMQSFLDTASNKERVKNQIVRTWVRQVRDLSNDVEDSIDFILHIDSTKRSWWLRLLPSCGGKTTGELVPVDEAVAMTTMLRARVVDVSQRNIRYNLISDDSVSKPRALASPETAAASTRTSGDILLNGTEEKSRLSDDLVGLIISEDTELQVISICGTGGDNGDKSIIRNAFDDQRIHQNFKCRAWVKLQHPFNLHEFTESLQLYTHSCEAQRGGEVVVTHAVTHALTMEELKRQRYLVVLEDLSTISQWDAIRKYLPDMKNGSRIVVSTHDLQIASLCPRQPCSVKFSAGHSVSVFFKEVFQYDLAHSFIKEGLLGRKRQVDELLEEAKKRRLISVCGMPSVEKPVLLQAICDKFGMHSSKNSQDSKYLVVIDGLDSKDDWDFIKSNLKKYEDHPRSCIIMVTSDESVAKHCAASSNDAVYNIKGLEPDAGRELFRKVLEKSAVYEVKWNNEEGENTPAGEAADLLLSKCGGHPTVITTVAIYLASKPRDVLPQEMRRLRENFMQELATNTEFKSLRGVLAWMHSYLDACPHHLKKHMLYVSIFPQDIIIPRRRLIRRWIAEGYSKGTDSITMEQYAEKIFDEVAALSIMQPVLEAGKVIGYQVNGLFREYIMSRPTEETILFPVEVSTLEMQGPGRLTTEGIGQHLAVGSTWKRDRVLFESLDLSRLRSMTVFNTVFHSFFVSDRMRKLRVLDLENAMDVLDNDFRWIGKLPSRLKFLSLRGQRGVSRLPDSVGALLQLQTLDIRDTSIVTLPSFIARLRKLQCIRAGTTVAWTDDEAVEGSTPPSSPTMAIPYRGGGPIGRLQALQTLGAIGVNTARGEHILFDIFSRPQLKKLQVSGISGKHSRRRTFGYLLYSRTHLESLTLQFVKRNPFVHSDHICLPKSLRSLKMYGHVKQLPRNIMACDSLVKLTLEMATLFTAEVIEVLGRLPCLQTLRLRVNKDQDGELKFSNNLFSTLHFLEIACMSKLHVRFGKGAMNKLEHLKLHCLQGSGIRVFGLERPGPASLKHVWLLRSFDDALKEAVHRQLEKHPIKPALNPVRPRPSCQASRL